MALFGVAATMVSAWAVFLVRATLDENRKAAKAATRAAVEATEANRIARDDRRPWVEIDMLRFDKLEWAPRTVTLATVSFTNIGKSLAINGRCMIEIYEGSTQFFADARSKLIERYKSTGSLKLLPEKPVTLQEPALFGKHLFAEDGTVSTHARTAVSMCVFYGYTDTSGKNVYWTIKNYVLIAKNAGNGTVTAPPATVPFENVRVIADLARTEYV